MSRSQIEVDPTLVSEFCRRWDLRELSIFGSAVQGTMHARSDVDVLIELPAGRYPDIDEWDAMRDELAQMFGRTIDLVSKRGIENPFLRHHILTNREVLYAA
jgi:predicted nucleotidyltransferase